jgi:hypothetical protein
MVQTVNIFDLGASTTESNKRERLRIDENETAFVPFTPDTVAVTLHYCGESEIKDYVHCNGDDCVLCKIGRQKSEKSLMPVYDPVTKKIAILPLSLSLKPYALLPQMKSVLKVENRQIVFASCSNFKFKVASSDLAEDMDDGADVIRGFQDQNGFEDIASIYPRYENSVLKSIPAIETRLQLKGIA